MPGASRTTFCRWYEHYRVAGRDTLKSVEELRCVMARSIGTRSRALVTPKTDRTERARYRSTAVTVPRIRTPPSSNKFAACSSKPRLQTYKIPICGPEAKVGMASCNIFWPPPIGRQPEHHCSLCAHLPEALWRRAFRGS